MKTVGIEPTSSRDIQLKLIALTTRPRLNNKWDDSFNKENDKKSQGGNNQTFHSFPESIYIDRKMPKTKHSTIATRLQTSSSGVTWAGPK